MLLTRSRIGTIGDLVKRENLAGFQQFGPKASAVSSEQLSQSSGGFS